DAIDGHPVSATNIKLGSTNVDVISIHGFIVPSTDKAVLTSLRQMQSKSLSQPDVSGTYAIQQLDAQGTVLQNHSFTPAPLHNHSSNVVLDVSEVVPFVAGAAKIQIVQVGDGRVLASQPISAHAPSISGVALQGAPNPVTGNVMLGW